MPSSPLQVLSAKSGKCVVCEKGIDTKPHGVRVRLSTEQAVAATTLCFDCFRQAVVIRDGASATNERSGPKTCAWPRAETIGRNCGNPATVIGYATRPDGSRVAGMALCEEHIPIFKLSWARMTVTMQKVGG